MREVWLDLLLLAGLAALGYGIYQVSEPAAFVTLGVILVALALRTDEDTEKR